MTGLMFAFVVIMALFLQSVDELIEWVIFSFVLDWKQSGKAMTDNVANGASTDSSAPASKRR